MPPPDPEELDPGTSYHFEQQAPPPPPAQLKIDRKGKGRAVPVNHAIGAGSGSGVDGAEEGVMKFGEDKQGEDEADLYGE